MFFLYNDRWCTQTADRQFMAQNPTHYDLLTIPRSASTEDIKRAYRAQMRRYHPDRLQARRAQLQTAGDAEGLQRLEQQISAAVRHSQAINEAYRTLVDPQKRRAYDDSLYWREKAESQENSGRTGGYDFYAEEAPPPPPETKADRIPWPIIIGFLFFSLISFGFMSQFIEAANQLNEVRLAPGTVDTPAATAAPTSTASYIIQAQQLEAVADDFLEAENYENAVRSYTLAISRQPTATRYLKRGRAQEALGRLDEALDDYTLAIEADPSQAQPYKDRGLLFYQRWQSSSSQADLDAATADLEQYLTLIEDDDPNAGSIEAILNTMTAAEESLEP